MRVVFTSAYTEYTTVARRIMRLREWHDFIPDLDLNQNSVHVDLGSGLFPRNPLNVPKIIGTDLHPPKHLNGVKILQCDLTQELPFLSDSIFSFSAFDVLEHIPRWERSGNGEITFPFVKLIDEIFRCLQPGGIFIAVTPGFPSAAAFQDPTHVNFITIKTASTYFAGPQPEAKSLEYGFHGNFETLVNDWLSGGAVFSGLGKLEAFNNLGNLTFKQKLGNSKFAIRILRLLRHRKFKPEPPSHLLWVLRKPTN